jgi:hypothetical protein
MIGGFILLFILILYPVIVFFLTKRYFEEKQKADNVIFNKSQYDFEEFLKKKYLEKSLKSLQYGLLSLFFGIGNEIGAYIKYSEMTYLYQTIKWGSEGWWVKSNIQNETSYFINISGLNIVLVLVGISLIIYFFYSKRKIESRIIKNENKVGE